MVFYLQGDNMSNPALNEKTWDRLRDVTTEGTMTIEGTINKSGLLILITLFGAYLGWNMHSSAYFIGALLIGFVLSLVIILKPTTAPFLSQPYAFFEGLTLGLISSLYSNLYPGIITNTLLATMGCFVLMLGLYRFRIVRVTDKFRSVLVVATGAIALTYLVNLVMGFFGHQIPMIHEASPMGIAFSVIVSGVAAFNLLLDFDMIEQAHARNAPKFMEWYAGFALLLTLVWLYLELLRLMGKLNKK